MEVCIWLGSTASMILEKVHSVARQRVCWTKLLNMKSAISLANTKMPDVNHLLPAGMQTTGNQVNMYGRYLEESTTGSQFEPLRKSCRNPSSPLLIAVQDSWAMS